MARVRVWVNFLLDAMGPVRGSSWGVLFCSFVRRACGRKREVG